jgi:hypothetical protein
MEITQRSVFSSLHRQIKFFALAFIQCFTFQVSTIARHLESRITNDLLSNAQLSRRKEEQWIQSSLLHISRGKVLYIPNNKSPHLHICNSKFQFSSNCPSTYSFTYWESSKKKKRLHFWPPNSYYSHKNTEVITHPNSSKTKTRTFFLSSFSTPIPWYEDMTDWRWVEKPLVPKGWPAALDSARLRLCRPESGAGEAAPMSRLLGGLVNSQVSALGKKEMVLKQWWWCQHWGQGICLQIWNIWWQRHGKWTGSLHTPAGMCCGPLAQCARRAGWGLEVGQGQGLLEGACFRGESHSPLATEITPQELPRAALKGMLPLGSTAHSPQTISH